MLVDRRYSIENRKNLQNMKLYVWKNDSKTLEWNCIEL